MIFQKPSTRTRVSLRGRHRRSSAARGLYLAAGDLQLGRGETIKDTATVLSRYLDADHDPHVRRRQTSTSSPSHASIPVINGLTDEFHPCQALADVMTIRERFGRLRGRARRLPRRRQQRLPLAHGRVREARHGLRRGDARRATSPPRSRRLRAGGRRGSGTTVELTDDPREAAAGADVLYTDVWTSMGQEEERERRLPDLDGFGIDAELVRARERASDRAALPARRTTARRSPRTCSTARARPSGTRRRTACTPRRR